MEDRSIDVTGHGFADLLREYRERAGLSQVRLARLSGFDHSYLSRLERGHRAPTRAAVLRLAKALGLQPVERDRLLMAAGVAPVSALTQVIGDPVLERAARLLHDDGVPASLRAGLRQWIAAAVEQAERVAAAAWEMESREVCIWEDSRARS